MTMRRPPAAHRLEGMGTSIFSEISRLSVQHGAINLGQGFPDFPAPDFIKDAACRAIAADANQYAPAPGLPRLRGAVAQIWRRRGAFAVDADSEVTISAGATEAVFDAVMAVVNPGDEVVVFEPFYDAYLPAIRMAGGLPRVVRLSPPTWGFDPHQLASAFSARTKAVIVNTPHNPTGKVWSVEELDQVAALCVEHDAVAIADEVYSELVFGGRRHVSIATRPGMRDRTFTVDSLGKTFSVTGWKIGWTVACSCLTQALRGVHQFVTFCNATPFQEAAADALAWAEGAGYYDDLRAAYVRRRALLTSILHDAGLPTLPTAGTYFLMADIGHQGFKSDTAFCRHLVESVGVAAIPPSAFYEVPPTAPLLARFCFAKRDETMRAAGERLIKATRPAVHAERPTPHRPTE